MMKTKTTNNHGGARPGSGRKPVAEKRIHVPLSILPSILAPFRKKYGRGWARRVEEMINVETQPAKPRQAG